MTRAQSERATPDAGAVSLTLVIPFYDEAGRIEQGLASLNRVFADGLLAAEETEVIAVDDGSTDGSAELAQRLLRHLPRSSVIRLPANLGKGGAVKAGVSAAQGATIAYLDVDMSVQPEQLPDLVAALGRADVAIGSRAAPGSTTELAQFHRSVMGRTFNHLVHAATGLSIRDTQCGFKAFRAPVARLLFHFLAVDRFAFDVDILAVANRLGLTLAEVPVHWRHQAGSRVRPVPDTISMVKDLLRSNIVASRLGRSLPTTVPAIIATPGATPGAQTGPTMDPSAGPSTGHARTAERPLLVRTVGNLTASTKPVLTARDGRVLVLAPMEGRGTLDALTTEIGAALSAAPVAATVTVTELTLFDLLEMAPLELWAANREQPVASSPLPDPAPQPFAGDQSEAQPLTSGA